MVSEERKFHALLRRDFRVFVHKVFATLTHGQTYVPSWHIEAIAVQLERVRRGEVRRLIINMPARSLKSIAGSVAFPAFALGHDPSRRFICVSYSGELAKKHSNDFRAVIESPGIGSLSGDPDWPLQKTREPRLSSRPAAFDWRLQSAAHSPEGAATSS